MKPALLPPLNLDAATALALPLAEVEARAQFRFCLRLPDGDEEWLLARLCVVEPDVNAENFYHCVVLRPENAEANRIFVAGNLWYRAGRRQLDSWMTLAQAKRFKWDLFEQSFNDNDYIRDLSRYWKIGEKSQAALFKFGADGWGAICDVDDADLAFGELERFIWRRDSRSLASDASDLKFLRATHVNFRRKARALWKDGDGPIQTALRWSQLDEAQKSALAFECERGSWEQLREVAAWVLTVYFSRQKPQPSQICCWKFVDYGSINISGLGGIRNEGPLWNWRVALTESFGSLNVGAEGVKVDSLPVCLWSYINDDELSIIEVAPPSMHEVLEAQLQLRDWARQNLAPAEAARLLEWLQ